MEEGKSSVFYKCQLMLTGVFAGVGAHPSTSLRMKKGRNAQDEEGEEVSFCRVRLDAPFP